jgi:hypothetical protein
MRPSSAMERVFLLLFKWLKFIFSTLATDLNNLENKTKGQYLDYIK